MTIKAITFDAYGTLIRNEDMKRIPQRIIDDYRLPASLDVVNRCWADLYHDAVERLPFCSLRVMEAHVVRELFKKFQIDGDPTPYVDQFFEITTKVELYPETCDVLSALGDVRAAIISNADHEHAAAWTFTLPVEFTLISEAVGLYKPDPRIFRIALDRLGLSPHEVLHVGDSDVDDVGGAKAVGLRAAWVNRDGRKRRPHTPAPDYEIKDLNGLLPLL